MKSAKESAAVLIFDHGDNDYWFQLEQFLAARKCESLIEACDMARDRKRPE